MPNIPAVTEQPKPAETPATEQNVSEMTSSIVGRYLIDILFNYLHFSKTVRIYFANFLNWNLTKFLSKTC